MGLAKFSEDTYPNVWRNFFCARKTWVSEHHISDYLSNFLVPQVAAWLPCPLDLPWLLYLYGMSTGPTTNIFISSSIFSTCQHQRESCYMFFEHLNFWAHSKNIVLYFFWCSVFHYSCLWSSQHQCMFVTQLILWLQELAEIDMTTLRVRPAT